MISLDYLRSISCKDWNGHSHTEFCPHGEILDTEDMIKRAIDDGFKTYSITEHFPMPPQFYQMARGAEHAIDTAAMDYSELPAYFAKMDYLKRKYADKINILVGFEVDYIDGCQEWTKSQLFKFADQIDDAILSVHFLPTNDGLRSVDDSYQDFCDGVLNYYRTPVNVANRYLETVLEALKWEFDCKPVRYGHVTLYRRWRKNFSPETVWADDQTNKLLDKILKRVCKQNLMLDCNMSGLGKYSQGESSPSLPILESAMARDITLVYGSDAHEIDNIDQGYNEYLIQQLYKTKEHHEINSAR
ncbi:histidinol-phosphatase HisJ [Companilactobacillus mishanensis]|uniref:histidinol-phosphatase HisJ n=1 Tax=Companilactobacillus mishanensis TaxID=2486008 RepID=UPI0012977FF1|nr:histidinol-phosphatase HisJ [Companilactobacillus mishanensis]MQS90136.1 histidinol-phosphatase HisJ [Companilactobacillus mishanensis]